MTHAWVIRSGSHGERDAWALESSCSGGGWAEVEDLTGCSTRDDVAHATAKAYAGAADAKLANFTGQLWALRGRIEPGDLMVMPMKTTKQIALGRVTGSYEYRAGEQDANKRHVVAVDWQRTDLPRSAVKQDLLFTLGSAMTIFSPNKNKAVDRLEHLLKHGIAAVARDVACTESIGKTLYIAGGANCRMTYYDFTNALMSAIGIGPIPIDAFVRSTPPRFFGDWVDTEESQRLLQYQRRGLNEQLEDMKNDFGALVPFIRLVRPLATWFVTRSSAYLKENRRLRVG